MGIPAPYGTVILAHANILGKENWNRVLRAYPTPQAYLLLHYSIIRANLPTRIVMNMTILTSKSILVAEDDEHIAHLLEFMLEREGYQVRLAGDGRAALQAIEQFETPPSLILLDVMMPYIDGFELIRVARERAGWRDIPIIILSAKSQEHEIVRALDAGATDYIVKPFQPNELLARLRRHLRAPR